MQCILIPTVSYACPHSLGQVDGFLQPEEMFRNDIAETIPSVRVAEKVMSQFRKAFDITRGRLPKMYKDGREPVPWTFEPDLVFSRFTKVHERLKTVFVSNVISIVMSYFIAISIITITKPMSPLILIYIIAHKISQVCTIVNTHRIVFTNPMEIGRSFVPLYTLKCADAF